MARSSKAALSRQTGDDKEEMIVQNQEIDTPVLPVEHMERLHQFRPDIVDWILRQTENEAAGGTIASIAIGTLAVAFIGKLKNN